ncbi:MAG: ATPase [Bacteroidaceae bacterium]|nr:ATPase [Bacteroidaceae bacterium]
MILVADSGSTKTAWCLTEDSSNVIYTQGINPFQQTEEDIISVLRHELMPSLPTVNCQLSTINFYGAGCTPEKAPLVANALRQVVSTTATIHVESDMLGAARSVCQHTAGIVCILGTGSNSCLYDGEQLHPGNPALGYILGDEGSGAYIGKRLVGDIFKHQLPEEIQQLFFEETQETQATIIQKVYRAPLPNRFLASLSPFCARHREHPAIHQFLLDCFQQFFLRNIFTAPWSQEAKTLPIHFVGSIAHHYQQELHEVAAPLGLHIGHIVQAPLQGLVNYHQS